MLKAEDRNPAMGHCSGCGWSGHLGTAATEPKLPPVAPKMPYVSIDIETTGLDPATCQILEIGAVWEDCRGDAYGLAMNAELLRRLSGQRESWFLDENNVADDMAEWLKSCGWDGHTALTPAGKNFASFDRQFLKRLPRFEKVVRLHHRTLDPAILYWQLTDDRLPDSKTCYERAGMDGKVAHTAVEDALSVVRLVRRGIKRLR
jgi:DNA polymerase III epsilon subunit-like protein